MSKPILIIMSLLTSGSLAMADMKLPSVFKGLPKTIGLSFMQVAGVGEPLFSDDEMKSIYNDFEKRLTIAGFSVEKFREYPKLLIEFTNFKKNYVSSMTYRLAFVERCDLNRQDDIHLYCSSYEIRNGHIADTDVVKKIFRQEISSQLDVFLYDRAMAAKK